MTEIDWEMLLWLEEQNGCWPLKKRSGWFTWSRRPSQLVGPMKKVRQSRAVCGLLSYKGRYEGKS